MKIKVCKCRFCKIIFTKICNNQVFCSLKCRLLIAIEKKENDCWEWQYGKDLDGYGLLSIKDKSYRASRISYEVFKGKIPEGYLVCHSCDNPSCINPDHLFSATPWMNMRDKINKNRDKVRGEQNSHAILNNEKVLKIREFRKSGLTYKKIAQLTDLHESHIAQIIRRKIWKHI